MGLDYPKIFGYKCPMRLETTKEVIDAIGGTSAAAKLTGRSYNAAHNWRKFSTFPANTYLTMTAALDERGHTAPPSLWGMQ